MEFSFTSKLNFIKTVLSSKQYGMVSQDEFLVLELPGYAAAAAIINRWIELRDRRHDRRHSGSGTLWTGTYPSHPYPSHTQPRRSSSRNSQRPTMLPLIRLDISPDKYLSSCRLSVGESAINAALMCAQFFRLARAALARRSLICAPIVWATTRYERLGRHTAKSNTPAMPINIALRLPRRGPSRRLATIAKGKSLQHPQHIDDIRRHSRSTDPPNVEL